MNNSLIFNSFLPDEEEDVWPLPSQQTDIDPEKKDNVVEAVQTKTDTTQTAEKPKILSKDDFFKATGLDQLPELQPYYSEGREKSLEKRTKVAALSDALRLVIQGFGANKGAYIAKDPENKVYENTRRELEKIKDAKDAENRATQLRNAMNEMQKTGMYAGYLGQQLGYEHQSNMQDKSFDQQGKLQKERLDAYNKRYSEQWKNQLEKASGDKEWEEKIMKIKMTHENKMLEAKTEKQMELIDAQAAKEIEVLNHRYKSKEEGGAGLTPPGATPTIPININGEIKELTQVQIDQLAFDAIKNFPKDKLTQLPPVLMEIIMTGKTPSAREAQTIVRTLYGENTSTGNLWGDGNDTPGKGKGTANLWDDEELQD